MVYEFASSFERLSNQNTLDFGVSRKEFLYFVNKNIDNKKQLKSCKKFSTPEHKHMPRG
jgi:hypothetical protein